jgi:hypothetical protein
VGSDSGAPQLVLLQTAFSISDPTTLQDPLVWMRTDLDAGGWDFDARREEQTLAVLHRRVAPAYAANFIRPVDLAFGPFTIRLSENASLVSRTLTQMATENLVFIEADLASATVSNVDAGFPFGENPRIHGIAPFIATVDRLDSGRIVVGIDQLRLSRFHSQSHLVMRTSRGWRTAHLLGQRTDWPRTLDKFARIQQAIFLQPIRPLNFRLSWNSLWTIRPIVLFKQEETDKGRLLTFGHQDSDLGALRATTFRVFEDDGGDTLKANAESFTLLDIGHRHIPAPGASGEEPIEYQQLRPRPIDSRAPHADGPQIVRQEESANTMTGALVAHDDRPASFYAYTEMGDGGSRVVFDGGLVLPPPTATVDEKTFRPAWVAEPALAGRA